MSDVIARVDRAVQPTVAPARCCVHSAQVGGVVAERQPDRGGRRFRFARDDATGNPRPQKQQHQSGSS